jgi:hypothetical protein
MTRVSGLRWDEVFALRRLQDVTLHAGFRSPRAIGASVDALRSLVRRGLAQERIRYGGVHPQPVFTVTNSGTRVVVQGIAA